jgi:pyrroline-5-carboxylate reductase
LPTLPTLAILGAGNMTGAVLDGLLASDALTELPVRVTTRSQASADRFDDDRIVATAVETDAEASRNAVRGAGIVLLGVKPHMIADLLDEVGDAIAPGTVVISVAAGITIAAMEAKLAEGVRVVRAMPNTPAAIGIGATGIAAGTAADDEAMGFARAIFEAVGIVAEVDEAQIADVAAVSGSGPAYVFYLIEQMVAAAIRIGMPEDQAHEFVVQTFRGAIGLVHANPDVEPSELRRRVTSPKGTTERAIQVLEAADLGVTFEQAMRSNVRRSEELAAGS